MFTEDIIMKISTLLESKISIRFVGMWNPQMMTYLPDVNNYVKGNVLLTAAQGTVDGVLYLKDSFLYHDGSRWIPVNNVNSLTGITWDVASNPQLPESSYPFALIQIIGAGEDTNRNYYSVNDVVVLDSTGSIPTNITKLNYSLTENVLNYFSTDDASLESDETLGYLKVYRSYFNTEGHDQVEFQVSGLSPFDQGTNLLVVGMLEQDKPIEEIILGQALALFVNITEADIVLQIVEVGKPPQFAVAPAVAIDENTVVTLGIDKIQKNISLKIDDNEIVFSSAEPIDLTDFDFDICNAAVYASTATTQTYEAKFSNLDYSFGYPVWQNEINKFNGDIRFIDTNYNATEYPDTILGNAIIFESDTEIGSTLYRKGESIFWDGTSWTYLNKIEKSIKVANAIEDKTIIPYDSLVHKVLDGDELYTPKNLVKSNGRRTATVYVEDDDTLTPLYYSHRVLFPEKYFSSNPLLLVGDSRRTGICLNFEFEIQNISGTDMFFGIGLNSSKDGVPFSYPNNLSGDFDEGSLSILYSVDDGAIRACIKDFQFIMGFMYVEQGDTVNFVVGSDVPDPDGEIPFNLREYKVGVFLNGRRVVISEVSQYLSTLIADTWQAYSETFRAVYNAPILFNLNTGRELYKYSPLKIYSSYNPQFERDHSGFVFTENHPLELVTKETVDTLFATKLAKKVLVNLPIEINAGNFNSYLDCVLDFKSSNNATITINSNTPDGFQCVIFQTDEGRPSISYSGVIHSYNGFTTTGGKGSPMTIQKLDGELFIGGVLGE